nr:hypothetical protein [Tanacetum cinerariifolium]
MFNFSKYIFDSLVHNVDSSSKFYLYPRFIQLIIQAQVGDLSTHTTRFISPALTQKVFANMRRVRKGFLGVETPLFEEDVAKDVAHVATPSPPPHGIPSPPQKPSSPPQQPHVTPPGEAFPATFQQVLDTCFALLRRVKHLEHDNVAQRVEKGFSGVEIPLFESMLAVRDVAEEAEAHVPAQGDDVQEPTAEEVDIDVVPPTPTSPSPSSPVIPSSPPHQPPCPPQPQDAKGLENDKAAQQLEIVKLKARVKKLENINKVKSFKLRWLKKFRTSQRVESLDDVENVFNQGRKIVDMDQDEGIELVADQEKDAEVEGRHADKQAEIYNIDLDHSSKVLSMQKDDTEVQEAVEIVTTAKLMTEVVTAAATQVAAASIPILAVKPKILTITVAPATPKMKEKGKGILIEAPKPMKKKDHIEMDAEYARKLQEEINKEPEEAYKNIDWNAALDHVQSKEPQYIKRYHGMKKKSQTESEARKNMIFYLKNTEGYKMDSLKGKKYDEILPIFQAKFDANMKFLFKSREEMEKEDEEIIKSINKTPAQKATKRRKLCEEAQEADDLRKRLEIVQDEDDDVFVEATLLAQKVPISNVDTASLKLKLFKDAAAVAHAK